MAGGRERRHFTCTLGFRMTIVTLVVVGLATGCSEESASESEMDDVVAGCSELESATDDWDRARAVSGMTYLSDAAKNEAREECGAALQAVESFASFESEGSTRVAPGFQTFEAPTCRVDGVESSIDVLFASPATIGVEATADDEVIGRVLLKAVEAGEPIFIPGDLSGASGCSVRLAIAIAVE